MRSAVKCVTDTGWNGSRPDAESNGCARSVSITAADRPTTLHTDRADREQGRTRANDDNGEDQADPKGSGHQSKRTRKTSRDSFGECVPLGVRSMRTEIFRC